MKIISVVGRKNSGKTSLTIKIIQELKSRGYSVSSIKHSHHQLNMDKENTDTWRHKEAGSETIVGVGATTHFNITKDLDLERLLFLIKVIDPVDFVVIEGFKRYNYPKIATTTNRPKQVDFFIKNRRKGKAWQIKEIHLDICQKQSFNTKMAK